MFTPRRRHRNVEKRGRLLAVAAALVVVAMLLPSFPGSARGDDGQAPPRHPLAATEFAGNTFPGGDGPWDLAFDPENGYLYVADFGSSTVSVINTSTNQILTQIPLTFGLETIVVDTSTGFVYTANTISTVYAISPITNQVAWTTSVAPEFTPNAQTYDASNGDIYVTDLSSDVVSVIHTASVVATIPVGASPNGAAYDTENGDIYVSNEGSCLSCINVTVINGTTNRVVGQVHGAGGGPGVAYDSSNGDIYTCTNGDQNDFTNFISAANGTTNAVVASIPIGSGCQSAVYDPVNDYVYITDRYRFGVDLSNVTVVDPDTNRIVLNLPVQTGPTGIAYDSANQNVYVADSDTNNISVLPQIYRLTVHETGLPSGTNWSATVGGATFSSTTTSITFPKTNGTFNFTVGNVASRCPSPGFRTVQVAGGPREQNVTFSTSSSCGSTQGLFGLPGETGYYVLGGFVAALVAAAVVFVLFARRKRPAKPSPTTPPPDGASGREP